MKGKAKGKPKVAVAAVAVKEEEKVEAWMVSLAVVDEPEESFDEEMDIHESQSYLNENFDEEFASQITFLTKLNMFLSKRKHM